MIKGTGVQFGVCQWCLPEQGPACMALVKKMGYDGIQMDMGLNNPERDLRKPEVLQAYIHAAEAAGLKISSLGLNWLDLNNPENSAATKTVLIAALKAAQELGCKTIQLCSFFGGGMETETAYAATAENLRYACDQAKLYGITIGSENQLDLLGNQQLIADVARENFGIYFDTANPLVLDNRDGITMLGGLYDAICESHVKDYKLKPEQRCAPLGEGDCQFVQAAEIFKNRKYQKWLVVENNLPADLLQRDLQMLQDVFAHS